MSIHDEFVPPVLRGLSALSKILGKAAAHCEARKIDPAVLLAARLYPDMFTLTRQVQVACDMVRRGGNRLAATEPANVTDDETDIAALQARIASTRDGLLALKPADLAGAETRTVTFPVRGGEMSMDGSAYLRNWVLPNFYFHCATAYGILRHNGVELGKADFLAG
ncbi:MAG: DUF1993 domain-containing protein [Paracoccaceae bacterium]